MLKRLSAMPGMVLEEKVIGFTVFAKDGEIGHVEDVLINADTNEAAFLLVDVGFWIFGKKVMVPLVKTEIDYANNEVRLPWDKNFVRKSPQFSPEMGAVAEKEEELPLDFELPYYWKGAMPGSTPVSELFGPKTPSAGIDVKPPRDRHDLEIKEHGD